MSFQFKRSRWRLPHLISFYLLGYDMNQRDKSVKVIITKLVLTLLQLTEILFYNLDYGPTSQI
jgi:hypothetical protein